jgi:two-component sensor histidine kinase
MYIIIKKQEIYMADSKDRSDFERSIEDKSNLIDKLQDAIVISSQQADEERISRIFAENLFNTVHEPILVINSEFKIITANSSFYDKFNLKEDILNMSLFGLADIKLDIPELRKLLSDILSSSGQINNYFIEIEITAIGRRKFLLNANKVAQSDDMREFILLSLNDITEQFILNERRDTLMREMHHRIKNNLIVIQTLLKLQSRDVDDNVSKGYFEDTRARVQSISLIHEMLYHSQDLSSINFSEYIGKVIEAIDSYYNKSSRIGIDLNVPSITLDLNNLLPLGLIITELITNSYKYAFPDNRRGRIMIDLSSLDNNNFVLTVRDNGIGIPQGFDINKANSFGMKIVTSLVGQIRADLEIIRDAGATFVIRFRDDKWSSIAP